MSSNNAWNGLSFTVDTEFEQAEAATERMATLAKQFYACLTCAPGALQPDQAFYLTGIFISNVLGYRKAAEKPS
jgi:hypothetical protein